MSLLSNLLAPPRPATRGLNLTDTAAWMEMAFTQPTAAGVPVSQEGSLRSTAVFACVQVLSQTMAQLPLHLYERQETGDRVSKRKAREHYLYNVLHLEPNPLMTSAEWRQTLQGHLALWGNAYCEIEYDGGGRPVALWPLRPDMVREIRRTEAGLAYLYELPDGKQVVLPGERVLHLRGLAGDGLTGYSPIRLARQAVGLSMAAEEFGARFFGNDARPGGVLQHPGVLGKEAFERLQQSWESRHQGLSRSHRIAVLEEGMTYNQIGVPPQDAQFLETRKFQTAEVARMFRVPLHMIGDLERSTNNNIEQQSLEFVKYTMAPWLTIWEQAIETRLLTRAERATYFARFALDGLLRGDITSRYQAYATGRQNGWLSANDIRELEDQNPIDGGDVYLVPLNMVPADMAGQESGSGQEPAQVEEPVEAQRAMHRMVNGVEIRAEEWNAAGSRHRLEETWRPLWEDAAGRLVRREANDVGNAAKRMLGKGAPGKLREWLERFYDELAAVAEEAYLPVMTAYAAQVGELAAREVGGTAPALTAFVAAYVSALGLRQAGFGRARVTALLDEFGDEALGEIEKHLEHHKATRPGRIGREESVRANNAAALASYQSNGVGKKRWVTFGDNCPYCSSLAGTTVQIEFPFLMAGQDYKPEGADRPLSVTGHIGHAPAHEGCNCMVVAA